MPKDHAKYHEDTNLPHNKSNPDCQFPIRCPDEMYGKFLESLSRNPSNLRAGGKIHDSIIGRPLFPLTLGVKKQIMVPILHISTGVMSKMITTFFQDIQSLDDITFEEREVQESLENEIDVGKEKIREGSKVKAAMANQIIDIQETLQILKAEESYINPECAAENCKVVPGGEEVYTILECEYPDHDSPWNAEFHAVCEGMKRIYLPLFKTLS